MPIFEYRCNDCGMEFEELVSGQNPEIRCIKCKSKNVKKKFSVFGMSGVEKQVSSCTSCSSSSCNTCK
jgi:putative FmdB family regulatory protein